MFQALKEPLARDHAHDRIEDEQQRAQEHEHDENRVEDRFIVDLEIVRAVRGA